MKSFRAFINESANSHRINEGLKKVKAGKDKDYADANGFTTNLDNLNEGDVNEVSVYLVPDGSTVGKDGGPALVFEVTGDNEIAVAVNVAEWKKTADKAKKVGSTPFKKHSSKPIAGCEGYDVVENEDGCEVDWIYGDEDSDSENMTLYIGSPSGDCRLEFVGKDLNEFIDAVAKLK